MSAGTYTTPEGVTVKVQPTATGYRLTWPDGTVTFI